MRRGDGCLGVHQRLAGASPGAGAPPFAPLQQVLWRELWKAVSKGQEPKPDAATVLEWGVRTVNTFHSLGKPVSWPWRWVASFQPRSEAEQRALWEFDSRIDSFHAWGVTARRDYAPQGPLARQLRDALR